MLWQSPSSKSLADGRSLRCPYRLVPATLIPQRAASTASRLVLIQLVNFRQLLEIAQCPSLCSGHTMRSLGRIGDQVSWGFSSGSSCPGEQLPAFGNGSATSSLAQRSNPSVFDQSAKTSESKQDSGFQYAAQTSRRIHSIDMRGTLGRYQGGAPAIALGVRCDWLSIRRLVEELLLPGTTIYHSRTTHRNLASHADGSRQQMRYKTARGPPWAVLLFAMRG